MNSNAPPLTVREAVNADCPSMAAIVNQAIVEDTANWSWWPKTADAIAAWCEERRRQDYAVLVAEAKNKVVGYAGLGPFLAYDGCANTASHSVYVDRAARGLGVGRALMEELILRAEEQGLATLVAEIDAANSPSLRLHERLGFIKVGQLPGVGLKCQSQRDLVLMVLRLAPLNGLAREEPTGLPPRWSM